MANILVVSRGGYYKFFEGKRSVNQERDSYLLKRIAFLFEESRQTYGSPRIHAFLKSQGEKVSLKRDARLMREYKLIARKKQRFKVTTKVNKSLPIVNKILQRDFKAQRPNQKWVSDITIIFGRPWDGYMLLLFLIFSHGKS